MPDIVEPLVERRLELQQTMTFLGALASGMEQMVGRGATGMSFAAGRNLGRSFAESSPKTTDIEVALEEVRKILAKNHCLWGFEVFKPSDQPSAFTTSPDGVRECLIVFRDCMIRQALFTFGHAQKGSLCTMMYGFFSGALEVLTGGRAELDILHAGENGCLKRLRLHPAEKAVAP